MARIQVLPLPTETVGDAEHTPFILIIDEVNPFDENRPHFALDALKHETGAASIIVTETSLHAPGSLTLTDEERDQLREYLLTGPRPVVIDTLARTVTTHLTADLSPYTNPPAQQPPHTHP